VLLKKFDVTALKAEVNNNRIEEAEKLSLYPAEYT
jgi:hypothetical protein